MVSPQNREPDGGLGGVRGVVDRLELVDQHCHAVIGNDLTPSAFELLLGESGRPAPTGCSTWDTSLGLAVRTWCAPRLDLPAGVTRSEYLMRRRELGASEVNTRLLSGGASELLVDTGYRSAELASLDELGQWSGATVHEIVRLETIAEDIAAALSARRGGAGARYADAFAEAMARRSTAVGWKSVAAYRCGLDLDWRRPSPDEVRTAADTWLRAGPSPSTGGWRLTDPVLIRHGVWAALDTGRPLQVHTGFGDTDATLRGSDPALLTDLAAMTADRGTPIVMLHCWPRHREAGYLTLMWPHLYLDIGETIPHVGGRGDAILAETLELAPWHKVLYSSDAFGLAELYHLGTVIQRRALAGVLAPLEEAGFGSGELIRLAGLVGHGNARRIYAGVGRAG